MSDPAEEAKGGAQTPPALMTATIIAVGIAAFLAIISVWYVQTHAAGAGAAPRLVFVDGNAIFKAQVKAFVEGKGAGSPEAAEKSAKEFSTKLNAALTPYKDGGYIVLNSAMAMNIPEGLDITAQVAKQVGVEIR